MNNALNCVVSLARLLLNLERKGNKREFSSGKNIRLKLILD